MTGTAYIEAGLEWPPRQFGPITRTDIVRYAGASGDFTPVHHDEAYARASGSPGVFSMGMFQASLLATYAADYVGANSFRRFRVRFVEKVWPGDVLVCRGWVTALQEEREVARRATIELQCITEAGTLVLTASADIEVPMTG